MDRNTPGREWTAPALRAEIEAFVTAHHTMALATVSGEGGAHAVSLLYVADGLSVVWTSDPGSRHSLHLAMRRRVTATIAPDYSDFAAIRGVQMAGKTGQLSNSDEIQHARALLASRYPFLAQLSGAPAALRAAWDQASFYRLMPSRITLIDNTRGFGHKATLLVVADGSVALG